MAVFRWAYKHSRELARRMRSYRGEYAIGHPKFAEGSEAVCRESDKPVEASAPKIKYTPEDDKAIDDHIRTFGVFTFITWGQRRRSQR
jgi:alcohol oxidase